MTENARSKIVATRQFNRLRSLLVGMFVCAVLALAVYLGAVFLSGWLLAERQEARSADMIVVLGGDGAPRAAKAAELWHQGFAPSIVVAGEGDCTFIRDVMIDAGVAGDAISIECLSRSTWENALNTSPFLEAAKAQSAILVTSLFHSRRAVTTFRALCPGVEWISVPARPAPVLASAFGIHGLMTTYEYIKSAAYAVRAMLLPEKAKPGELCLDETRG